MTHCHTIIDTLRARGFRITPQREIVVDILAHAGRHMSAEEIFSKLQERTQVTNISTVYRTLDVLWEEGFARRNDLSEGRIVYATTEHGPHIHLVCRRCNHVVEAEPEVLAPLGSELQTKYNFEADLQHLSIFGICSGCQQQGQSNGGVE
jgi:Fur family ferric uptake transcriptional regulator